MEEKPHKLECRNKKTVYNLWKQLKTTWEYYKDVVRLCSEKMRRDKGQLELTIKDNKKSFCKHISNKRRAKENLPSSLEAGGKRGDKG